MPERVPRNWVSKGARGQGYSHHPTLSAGGVMRTRNQFSRRCPGGAPVAQLFLSVPGSSSCNGLTEAPRFPRKGHGRFFIRSPVRFSCACGRGVCDCGEPSGPGSVLAPAMSSAPLAPVNDGHRPPPREFLRVALPNFGLPKLGQQTRGGVCIDGQATGGATIKRGQFG